MNKVLTITLVVLLVGLMGLTACGTRLTEQDIATIRGFGTRIDSLESKQATLSSQVANLSPGTLQTDIDQIKADQAAIKADITSLKADWEKFKTTSGENSIKIAELETRIRTLEGTSASPSDGKVTVEFLDEEEPVYLLSSSTGTNLPSFRVVIANGTDDYRYVSFWINLSCVSQDGLANVTAATLTLASPVFGQPTYEFATTLIPNDGNATTADQRQILFTPTATIPKIPVKPGETLKLYLTLELKTEVIEEWEMVLSGVTISETWGL